MKIKNWLIHKLGGSTQEEILRDSRNYIRYQQTKVLTYKTGIVINKFNPIPEDYIKEELAMKFLDCVRENMVVGCFDSPKLDELNEKEYRAELRIVADV